MGFSESSRKGWQSLHYKEKCHENTVWDHWSYNIVNGGHWKVGMGKYILLTYEFHKKLKNEIVQFMKLNFYICKVKLPREFE